RRGASRRRRFQALPFANCGGTSSLAAKEAVYRQCLRIRSDDLSRRKLYGQTEYGSRESRARRVLCAIRYGRLAAPTFARSWRMVGRAGDRFTYYKLVDSVLPLTTDKDGHEKDFFDGLDTSLPGLASRLGDEEKKVPQLRAGLVEIAGQLKQAAQLGTDPNDNVRPLLAALDSIGHLVGPNNDLSVSAAQALLG